MKKLPTPHEQSWPVKKETSDYVRQQQEEAASKVDADFYRIIVETIREPVFVHRVFENGETGMFERVNTAACLMTGYAETELLRMRPVDLYEKEDLKHYSMAEYPDYEGRHNECLFESIIRHKSGKRIVTETSVNKVIFGSTPYFISTVHEITLRKEAYRDLAESNSRLQLIMDAAHAGIWEWNIQTNANIWTDELWRLYGLEPHSGEASYDLWLQSIALEDREKTEQIIIQSSKKGMEFTAEWRVHTEDGSERWLMSKGTPFRDRNGKVNRYVGIVLDVTRLKLAQKAEITEQSFRKAIIESIPGTFYPE